MHHVITSQYFIWKLHFHAIKVDFCWASLDVQEKCRQKLDRGWKFLRVRCKCPMITWPRCRWCEYVFVSGSPQSSEMEPFLLTIMAQMEEHMTWRLHGSLWTVSPASKTTHCCSNGKVKPKRLSEHKKAFPGLVLLPEGTELVKDVIILASGPPSAQGDCVCSRTDNTSLQ